MRALIGRHPLSQDLEMKKQNDIWALGKTLSAVADISCNPLEQKLPRSVALATAAEVPSSRISLCGAILKLKAGLDSD